MQKRAVGAATLVVAATAAAVAIADTGSGSAVGDARWVHGAVRAADEPAPAIRVGERDGGVRIVVRHHPGAPERLAWSTRPDTAKAGTDFEARSGVVQFRPGQVARTIRIPVHADGVAERAERFTVVLDHFPGLPEARGGAIASVMITDR
jgi:hypothetical protein